MTRARLFDWSCRLIIGGLIVELASLLGLHYPWGFLLFALGGATLVAAGVVMYVYIALRPNVDEQSSRMGT